MPPKHYKTGEKQAKNLGPSFDATLDQVLTQKKPNLGPIFDSTTYIYICCCVRKWGAFLRFNRSIMLPFMRSIMGCAESGAWNPYFYSVSGGGGGGPVILAGAQNIGRDLGASCRKWGCSKHSFALSIWHLLLGWIGCEAGFFFGDVQKCPELRENWGFYIVALEFANMRLKIGVSEKKGKIYFWCRTHHHFCVFWCRASFSQKKVFPKSTKFRWNHWKRSAKLARPQNAIFAPKGPK